MINKYDNLFVLNTKNTTYAFKIRDGLFLEHLYYGKRITLKSEADAYPLEEKTTYSPGNSILYDREHDTYQLKDLCLEVSGQGKGDHREPFVELVFGDLSKTTDFIYDSFEIRAGKRGLKGLPSAYVENLEEVHSSGLSDCAEGVSELVIFLKDRNHAVRLELTYSVFEDTDVITRSAALFNDSEESILVKRLYSAQLDFATADFKLTHFNGAWIREMCRYESVLTSGKQVNSSNTGLSSNEANPFFMLSEVGAGEDFGDVYGLNLIYSGNHAEVTEVSTTRKTRVLWGINPETFSWELGAGEVFQAPEAVMTFSDAGYNGMSRHMHEFVREHVTRGKWHKSERPVLLNSWEAAYMDINEEKLVALAKTAKKVGVELFVMDDGWFGKRNDDTSSLGDWYENPEKLPGGIASIADKIEALGLKFGIWVEPEMTNEDSELFRKHPDWTLEIPGQAHSEGRNQRALNMGLTAVQDYVIESMKKVFSSGKISYVKWDMNRNFSDVFSQLPYDKETYEFKEAAAGEVCHRYVLGLYRCMDELTKAFPDILFEGCAGGGNRFDLGILSYFPQMWASDDSDALSRVEIQTGYSYGYPLCTLGCHVSAVPNHQTLRVTSLNTRFSVAAFGSLGYECDLNRMSEAELDEIKAQIELYKQLRKHILYGEFYRGRSFTGADSLNGSSVLRMQTSNVTEWTVVSKSRDFAMGMIFQRTEIPNLQFQYFKPCGLCSNVKYSVSGRDISLSLKALGTQLNADYCDAKFSEEDRFEAFGDTLMNGRMKLLTAYSGVGIREKLRLMLDNSARLYFFDRVK